jgi:hypothetical protein
VRVADLALPVCRASPALALFFIVAPAGAADPPAMMSLDFRREPGAEACPDEQEFRDAMTANVHRTLFDPAGAARLVVRLQGRSGWYRGVAELRDAAGVPIFTIPPVGPIPRDCSAVADSLALSIAIKVDPRGRPPAAPEPVAASHRLFGVDGEVLPMPPPPGQPPATTPDASAPAPAPPEPEQRIRLGMSGGVAIAAVPGWAPSFALDVGVRWRDRPLSLAFEGAFVPSASGDVTVMASGPHLVHVTAYRATGAGVACGHFLRYLFACGIAELGALHATSSAMSLVAQPATAFYGAAGGRGGAEFPVHPHVALRIAADALVTFARPVFDAGGAPVFEASLVSGTAGGGVVFTF